MPAKILAIEDTLDTRELLHLYLTGAGFNLIIASDGREGLYLARAEHPELIITDLNLPGLDGLSLLKELRAEPVFKDTPIIVLSASGRGDAENAILAGATRVVEKPTDFENLIDDVNELLDERKKTQGR